MLLGFLHMRLQGLFQPGIRYFIDHLRQSIIALIFVDTRYRSWAVYAISPRFANYLGFPGSATFTRVARSQTGYTPSEFGRRLIT